MSFTHELAQWCLNNGVSYHNSMSKYGFSHIIIMLYCKSNWNSRKPEKKVRIGKTNKKNAQCVINVNAILLCSIVI